MENKRREHPVIFAWRSHEAGSSVVPFCCLRSLGSNKLSRGMLSEQLVGAGIFRV